MTNNLQLILLPFLVSLLISLVMTPIVIKVFRHFNFVVDPKLQKHPAHLHQTPLPKGGGIPIILAITLAALLFLKMDNHLAAILVGAWLTVIVGLIDDVRPVSPYIRLFCNFLAAAIVVMSGIGIAYITNPMGGIINLTNIEADLFALLWIPFVMNAINFSSGLDGQVSGVVAIAAIVIGLLSLNYSADITQWSVTVLAFALAGGFVGFAVYHFYPQKIMPGYSGTTVAGFLLAVLAILATAKIGTALVVLGLPAIDTIYAILRRLAKGKSPIRGDKEHLHHKLLDMGWSKIKVAIFYWFITALLGVIALNTNATMKLFAILALSIIIASFFLWIYFGQFSKRPDHVSG